MCYPVELGPVHRWRRAAALSALTSLDISFKVNDCVKVDVELAIDPRRWLLSVRHEDAIHHLFQPGTPRE